MNRASHSEMEFFHRRAIRQLSIKEREIYLFIIKKENQLVDIAISENHYLQLMKENPPFKAAAAHFLLDEVAIKQLMDEAQTKVDRFIEKSCNQRKWINYSNYNNKSNYNYFFVY
ncbi:hypothetical protein AJ85_11825 [Alkalihalobacillus alcalophilus ATCC 27647 = CGMCC 1.3604]|uniref:Uncharacterized protein n=1 Tax=Alkalihalobacillus alcalophilus ATCC 27647 = CGMCC 1.3604 TaxID=1218173 RepID=A0A094WJG6_ALKAL|nr:hypothetical protein [Alkalihalobacillus alcalophilus]KGA96981.1 hypothetical protein BALCAV_0212850 [Alkalihalobacillus alcalophilus ATCC 27647 = CGMCC 1.3604]MED1564217.1 hypothetical protein [Alkalihalobacillus alcalophilus]THG90288.1 hypothetical protein AJ85_11825 [Alkalihalobacillus alcalophilus ATCC 27647 = CGMCC 1.3604]